MFLKAFYRKMYTMGIVCIHKPIQVLLLHCMVLFLIIRRIAHRYLRMCRHEVLRDHMFIQLNFQFLYCCI